MSKEEDERNAWLIFKYIAMGIILVFLMGYGGCSVQGYWELRKWEKIGEAAKNGVNLNVNVNEGAKTKNE